MAGSWIPMRTNLFDDPDVLRMAEITGQSETYIVGALHRIWSWADGHCVDGVTKITPATLGRVTHHPEVLQAMLAVGWLEVNAEGVAVFTKWDRWMSHSAKARLQGATRVAHHRDRAAEPPCNARPLQPCNAGPLPHNSTVQDITDPPPPPPPSAPAIRPPSNRGGGGGAEVNSEKPDDFQAFWRVYPTGPPGRKGPRQRAARAYRAACSRTTPAQINAKALLYAQSDIATHEGGKFVKSAFRWLEEAYWEQDPSDWSRAPPRKKKSPVDPEIEANRERYRRKVAGLPLEPDP